MLSYHQLPHNITWPTKISVADLGYFGQLQNWWQKNDSRRFWCPNSGFIELSGLAWRLATPSISIIKENQTLHATEVIYPVSSDSSIPIGDIRNAREWKSHERLTISISTMASLQPFFTIANMRDPEQLAGSFGYPFRLRTTSKTTVFQPFFQTSCNDWGAWFYRGWEEEPICFPSQGPSGTPFQCFNDSKCSQWLEPPSILKDKEW